MPFVRFRCRKWTTATIRIDLFDVFYPNISNILRSFHKIPISSTISFAIWISSLKKTNVFLSSFLSLCSCLVGINLQEGTLIHSCWSFIPKEGTQETRYQEALDRQETHTWTASRQGCCTQGSFHRQTQGWSRGISEYCWQILNCSFAIMY